MAKDNLTDSDGNKIITFGYDKETQKPYPIIDKQFNADKASAETKQAILDDLVRNIAEQHSIAEANVRNNLDNERDIRKIFSTITRDCASAPGEIKEFITNEGRGLGNATELTDKQKKILELLYDNSIPCPQDITLYRTDDTNWLRDIKDDMFHINTVLQTTMDKNLVISENKNKVAQKMIILVSKGTKIFSPNNERELEIDIPYKQNAAIINKYKDDNNIPVYVMQIF